MKKDYIVIGGKQYRVEVNWNALTAFLKEVGRDTIEELASFTTIHPSEGTALMAACIAEGERLDGKGETPAPIELGALITPEDVKVFFDIYIRQSNPKRPADEPKKEEREENPAS
jgi:hypothetical protein